MPIRRELRKFYGREWREVVRPRILKRSGNKCERCEVPNQTTVTRVRGCWLEQSASWGDGIIQRWRGVDGSVLREKPEGPERRIRVVLAVAHLNHTPGEDDDGNLRAFCQWCHLRYDEDHHRQTRQIRKDAARPLLAMEGAYRPALRIVERTPAYRPSLV